MKINVQYNAAVSYCSRRRNERSRSNARRFIKISPIPVPARPQQMSRSSPVSSIFRSSSLSPRMPKQTADIRNGASETISENKSHSEKPLNAAEVKNSDHHS